MKKKFFFWNKKFFFETKNYLITDIYKVKKNTFPEKKIFFFNFENPGYGNAFVTKIAGYGNAIWRYIKNLFDYNLLVSQKDLCSKFLFKFKKKKKFFCKNWKKKFFFWNKKLFNYWYLQGKKKHVS